MRTTLLALLGSLLLADAAAARDGCTLDANERRTILLCYDHAAGVWRTALSQANRVDWDADGVPVVTPRANERLRVRIVNTNPLLYSARAGEPDIEDTDLVAGLRTLFAALGPGLQALAAFAGDAIRPRGAPAPPSDGAPVRLLAAIRAEHAARFRRYQGVVARLKRDFDAVAACRDRMVRRIQAVEHGIASPPVCDDVEARLAQFEASRLEAAEAAALFHAYGARYLMQADAFADVLALPGGPADSPPCPGPASNLAPGSWPLAPDTSALLVCDALARVPAPPEPSGDPADVPLDALARDIDAARAAIAASPSAATIKAQRARFDHLADALRPDADAQKLAPKLDDVLAKAPQLDLVAAHVRAAYARHARHLRDGAVATWMDLEHLDPSTPWHTERTYPLEITADSPYASSLAATHPKKAATAFRVRPAAARRFGVGIGVVVTDVAESSYGAAPRAPGDRELVIVETARSTRSGRLGAFLDIWPFAGDGPIRPGLQVGTALSGDAPAFFGGGVLELGGRLRLSGGVTTQRRRELDGQAIGDPVSSRDAIRTRDRFTHGAYVALSFALDSLTLFRSK
ncbi:MAG TPA: hypothetical protein VF198_08370 [Vicinamibacterales bacterium]